MAWAGPSDPMSPVLSFGDLQEKLDSIEGEDENDKYWNTSGLEGFNFEEDGPTMLANNAVTPQRPKNIEYAPKIEIRSTTKELITTSMAGRSSTKETAEEIFLGLPYNLEQFRSRQAKMQLLDAAIEIGDTSTIQVVVLFLRSTLKNRILQQELMARPTALDAYLNYLRENGEGSQLSEQLTLSGRANEVTGHRYRTISRMEDVKALQKALESALNKVFAGSSEYGLIKDQLTLLQLQTKINEIDEVTLGVQNSLIGSSLTATVHYCAKYHSKDPETHFASPAFFKETFNLSIEQYSYACISGYAEAQNYQAIENFLKSKSWLGKKKLISAIGFDKVVLILYQHKAPVELLEKYIAYVDDVQDRLELAEKVGALNALVNCHVQMKDRVGLEKLLSKLPRESTAAQFAQSSLGNPAIKWRS